MYSILKRFEYPGFLRKFSEVQWLPWVSRGGRSSADEPPWEKPYRGELKGITVFADFTLGLFERDLRAEFSRLLNLETGHSVLFVEFLKEGGDYELAENERTPRPLNGRPPLDDYLKNATEYSSHPLKINLDNHVGGFTRHSTPLTAIARIIRSGRRIPGG